MFGIIYQQYLKCKRKNHRVRQNFTKVGNDMFAIVARTSWPCLGFHPLWNPEIGVALLCNPREWTEIVTIKMLKSRFPNTMWEYSAIQIRV